MAAAIPLNGAKVERSGFAAQDSERKRLNKNLGPREGPFTELTMAQAKRTCVVIAGMHRSGTSALARVLNLLGCGLAKELLGGDPTNETGHWEPLKIIHFNDDLLESAGSAWDDWTACSPDWFNSPVADEFKEKAANIFADQYGTQRLTVMKDPRLARLLPFWLNSLRASNVDPVVMIPVRNPLEVAYSLHARNGFDIFYSELLWLRHVLDAEAGSRGVARHFSTYDQLLDSWTSLISSAEGKLGFKFPRRSARTSEEVDAYLADKHRHQRLNPKAVLGDAGASDWLKSTYAIMLKWSETGEDSADYARLDAIKSEFDRSAGTFARLIYRGKKAVEEANGLRQILAERDHQVASLRGEVEHARHVADQKEQEIGALRAQIEAERGAAQTALQSSEERLQHTFAEMNALSERAAASDAIYQAQIADLDARHHQTQAELHAAQEQINALHAANANIEAQHAADQANHHEQVAALMRDLEIAKTEAEANLFAQSQEHDASRTSLEAALAKEQTIVKGLTDHVALLVADLDAAKQAGEAALQAKSAELASAQSSLQVTTEELHEALALRAAKDAEVDQLSAKLAQLESAMRQRGAELDDVTGELKRVMDLLHIERHERSRIDKVVDGLKAHVKLLMEDVDSREADLAAKAHEIQVLSADRARLEDNAKSLEGRLTAQADGLMQGLINEPHHFFQTKGANLRRKAALLRSAKLLDGESYLRVNPDVAAAGVDPEVHYLSAGFAEGRPIN